MLADFIYSALIFWGAFYLYGLTSILAWINNYMPNKMWDEITYPYRNYNGTTVKVCE